MRRRPASGGFTLLELVVVLALAALIAGLIVPRLGGGLEGARVRSASRQVATLLRGARVQALAQRQTVTVSVDARRGELRVEPPPPGGTAPSLLLPADVRLTVLDESGRGRREDPTRIRFSARGGSDGGTLEVAGARRVITVAVDSLSGWVTVR